MSEMTAHSCLVGRSEMAYTTSWEHLSDELRWLDLRLHQLVLRQRDKPPVDPLAPFKGLVLSEAELLELLTHETNLAGNEPFLDSTAGEEKRLAHAANHLEAEIQRRRSASLESGVFLSLANLAGLFHLTRFEERCILIGLAPELSRKYEKLYAYLQDDITRKKPTVDLLLNLICENSSEALVNRVAFEVQAPLFKYRLCQLTDSSSDGPVSLLSRFLKLDDRIVSFLLGLGQLDARLEPVARLSFPQAEQSPVIMAEDIYSRTRGFVRSHFGEPASTRRNLILYLYGPSGSDQLSLAEAVCHDLGLTLLSSNMDRILGEQSSFEEIVWLLGRETLLQPAALFLEDLDCLISDSDKHKSKLRSILETIGIFSRLTFLAGSRPWQPQGLAPNHLFIGVKLPLPDAHSGKRFWDTHLKACDRLAADVESGELASRFRLGPRQIRDALQSAEDLAFWRSPEDGRITMADLYSACRAHSSPRLGALARKIEPRYTWDEIVLPGDQLAQLQELCNQAKWRHVVYGEWGFERKLSLGKGLNALFSGPPGTGKTMAAEVIAGELQLDLYQIDLSQVVSKYIGETEKNLHHIFSEAQASNAILFFDEADALFGKRSEIKDAHDRYANIEVGYLLQKMEEYEGISVLATNLPQHLDEAFTRRMHFRVEFPFPDEEHRRRIWHVVFPHEAPLAPEIDFNVLAREIKLAGGNIKNIALAAAFYAVTDGRVIRVPHLVQAARREFQKLGRTWEEVKWAAQGEPVS
jgi:SpoVK/Ycf46/Vps4 family AAA+-type ATPase